MTASLSRRGFVRVAGLAAAAAVTPAPGAAQARLKLAAVYTLPAEQMWVSRVHKALNAAVARWNSSPCVIRSFTASAASAFLCWPAGMTQA